MYLLTYNLLKFNIIIKINLLPFLKISGQDLILRCSGQAVHIILLFYIKS